MKCGPCLPARETDLCKDGFIHVLQVKRGACPKDAGGIPPNNQGYPNLGCISCDTVCLAPRLVSVKSKHPIICLQMGKQNVLNELLDPDPPTALLQREMALQMHQEAVRLEGVLTAIAAMGIICICDCHTRAENREFNPS